MSFMRNIMFSHWYPLSFTKLSTAEPITAAEKASRGGIMPISPNPQIDQAEPGRVKVIGITYEVMSSDNSELRQL